MAHAARGGVHGVVCEVQVKCAWGVRYAKVKVEVEVQVKVQVDVTYEEHGDVHGVEGHRVEHLRAGGPIAQVCLKLRQ